MIPQLKHKGRHDPQPKVTFYLTLVFELHGGTDQYTYSIDRCYTSLAQANDRLGLLSRCNTNTQIRETLRAGEDQDTGCQWCTWARPGDDAGDFRFYAEVKRIVMNGAIRHDGPTEDDVANLSGGLASTAEYRYAFEHRKDLANHVWAVALHNPEQNIAVDSEGKPIALPWALEGVYEASGNAMARGKRLWRDKLSQKQGRFDRMDSHYGFARYLLVPHEANTTAIGNKRQSIGSGQQLPLTESTAQVRVERIKVMPQGEMVAMFAPAEAILFDKPFQPLCKGREKEKGRKAVAKVEAELLDLFSAAGEDVAEHNMTPATPPDPRTLTPPPIRRRSLRSPQQQQQQPTFRPGVVQEYGQLAATLREPTPPTSVLKAQRKTVVSKGVASAKKHFYHTLENDNSRTRLIKPRFDGNEDSHAKKKPEDKKRPLSTCTFDMTALGPPVTPGQAALAAQQTLLLASRLNRG